MVCGDGWDRARDRQSLNRVSTRCRLASLVAKASPALVLDFEVGRSVQGVECLPETMQRAWPGSDDVCLMLAIIEERLGDRDNRTTGGRDKRRPCIVHPVIGNRCQTVTHSGMNNDAIARKKGLFRQTR